MSNYYYFWVSNQNQISKPCLYLDDNNHSSISTLRDIDFMINTFYGDIIKLKLYQISKNFTVEQAIKKVLNNQGNLITEIEFYLPPKNQLLNLDEIKVYPTFTGYHLINKKYNWEINLVDREQKLYYCLPRFIIN